MNEPDPVHRPEDHRGFADDTLARYGAPVAAVVAGVAVVAHHEELVGTQLDLRIADTECRVRRLVTLHRLLNARFVARRRIAHRLVDDLPVAPQLAVAHHE